MKEETKKKLRKIRLKYIQFMAKWGRGKGQFGIYNDLFQLTVMIGLQITLLNQMEELNFWIIHISLPQIPLVIAYPIVIFLMIFFVVWGFIDQRILKLTQAENEYAHEVLDTWLVKQFEDIKKELKDIKKFLTKKGRLKK